MIPEIALMDETGSNIIKFFSMMGTGAKQAAAEVGDSAGIIGTSFAMIKGGAKGASAV